MRADRRSTELARRPAAGREDAGARPGAREHGGTGGTPGTRALGTLAAALVLACGAEPAERRPNLLLLSLDSVRADHVGTAVRPRVDSPEVRVTPAFDRLAREGVRFENAVSTTSWTLPSHVALVTGLPDALHGVVDNETSIDPKLVTLAELLRREGWSTAGFYSGPYLDPLFGFEQGFDHYENCGTVVPEEVFESQELGRWREIHQLSHETVTSPALFERSSRWIRERVAAGEPFFAFVHWWDPHYDYVAPPEYAAMFDTGYRGDWTGVRGSDRRQEVHPEDVAHVRALYYAEIRYTDDHIGRLLALLDELGAADDTLVVYTSDHGEEFYERDRWGHQRTLYDEVVDVPLAVRLPGRVPAGRVAKGQARIQDVYATVADLLGLETPEYLAERGSRSLRALWEDEGHDGFEQPLSLVVPHRDIDWTGLRTLDAKVVWDARAEQGRLWNLARDPRERTERTFGRAELESSDNPAVARLRDWLESAPRLRAEVPHTPGRAAVELDEALRHELDAVGYLSDEEDD